MMLEITAGGLFYGLGRTYVPATVSFVLTYLRIPMALLFASWVRGIEAVCGAVSLSSLLGAGDARLLSLAAPAAYPPGRSPARGAVGRAHSSFLIPL